MAVAGRNDGSAQIGQLSKSRVRQLRPVVVTRGLPGRETMSGGTAFQ